MHSPLELEFLWQRTAGRRNVAQTRFGTDHYCYASHFGGKWGLVPLTERRHQYKVRYSPLKEVEVINVMCLSFRLVWWLLHVSLVF